MNIEKRIGVCYHKFIKGNEGYHMNDELVWKSLLQHLISIDTQNPPGNEERLVDFIIHYLELPEQGYQIYPHGNNRSSLVFHLPGKEQGNDILLLGHMDTVPVGEIELWSKPPLQGVEQDNRIYGRGACDMKGGVAVLLELAKHFLHSRDNKRSLTFAFTADEETGSIGIRQLVKENILHGVGEVIVTEPTGGRLAIGEKGVLWMKLVCRGKQAHGAMPKEGKNANEFLWKFIRELKQRCEKTQYVQCLGSISLSTTMFHGGAKENVIPENATAMLDVRTVHQEQHDEIRMFISELKESFAKTYGVSIEEELVNEKYPLLTPKGSENIVKMRELLENKELIGIPYYTDLAELLKNEKKPFMIYGPGEISVMHKSDEWVDWKLMKQCYETIKEYVLRK